MELGGVWDGYMVGSQCVDMTMMVTRLTFRTDEHDILGCGGKTKKTQKKSFLGRVLESCLAPIEVWLDSHVSLQ